MYAKLWEIGKIWEKLYKKKWLEILIKIVTKCRKIEGEIMRGMWGKIARKSKICNNPFSCLSP